jgi:hypothetical protein
LIIAIARSAAVFGRSRVSFRPPLFSRRAQVDEPKRYGWQLLVVLLIEGGGVSRSHDLTISRSHAPSLTVELASRQRARQRATARQVGGAGSAIIDFLTVRQKPFAVQSSRERPFDTQAIEIVSSWD